MHSVTHAGWHSIATVPLPWYLDYCKNTDSPFSPSKEQEKHVGPRTKRHPDGVYIDPLRSDPDPILGHWPCHAWRPVIRTAAIGPTVGPSSLWAAGGAVGACTCADLDWTVWGPLGRVSLVTQSPQLGLRKRLEPHIRAEALQATTPRQPSPCHPIGLLWGLPGPNRQCLCRTSRPPSSHPLPRPLLR